jgi:hypothetical protein
MMGFCYEPNCFAEPKHCPECGQKLDWRSDHGR